jgi:CBS domain-containing protein
MKLKDVMSREVQVVRPDATIQEAARKMAELNVGTLPICDGERLVGMVTDRDITVRAIAAGRDPKTTQIREASTDQIVYCFEDQDVREAARLIEEKQIRRLPVLNRDKRLVGIVSVGDLAVRTHDQGLAGEVVERVSEPSRTGRWS